MATPHPQHGQNASGKWVRCSAFREIDYDIDSPDRLREFDSFDKAFEFDEARRLDGTGGRHNGVDLRGPTKCHDLGVRRPIGSHIAEALSFFVEIM